MGLYNISTCISPRRARNNDGPEGANDTDDRNDQGGLKLHLLSPFLFRRRIIYHPFTLGGKITLIRTSLGPECSCGMVRGLSLLLDEFPVYPSILWKGESRWMLKAVLCSRQIVIVHRFKTG